MSIQPILVKLFNFFPEGGWKDTVRCFYYNHIRRVGFKVTHQKGVYEYSFKNGLTFKSHTNLTYDLENPIPGYFKEYALKEGDIVVDGGAYMGSFTIYAAKSIGEKGKVVAFEPDPEIFEILKKNIALNKLNNVIPVNKGLWSHAGVLKFKHSDDDTSTFVIEDGDQVTNELPVTSLDEAAQKHHLPSVDFIKWDIEGAELKALKGAQKTLAHNNAHLAIASYHIVDGKQTAGPLEAMLKKLGYKAHTGFPSHLTTYAFKAKNQ